MHGLVGKRLMTLLTVCIVLLVMLLVVAWYDGGREPQRLIVEEVDLPPVSGDNSQ